MLIPGIYVLVVDMTRNDDTFRAHLKRHKDSALLSSFPNLLADKLVKIVKPESMLMEANKNESEIHSSLHCNATFPNLISIFWHSSYHHKHIYECFACGECLTSEEGLCEHLNSHGIVIE